MRRYRILPAILITVGFVLSLNSATVVAQPGKGKSPEARRAHKAKVKNIKERKRHKRNENRQKMNADGKRPPHSQREQRRGGVETPDGKKGVGKGSKLPMEQRRKLTRIKKGKRIRRIIGKETKIPEEMKAEMFKGARRLAKLRRIRQLARQAGDQKNIERVKLLQKAERKRHNRRMKQMLGTLKAQRMAREQAPAQPMEAKK